MHVDIFPAHKSAETEVESYNILSRCTFQVRITSDDNIKHIKSNFESTPDLEQCLASHVEKCA